MNDSTKPIAAPEHSLGDTARSSSSSIYATMFLPKNICEVLPSAYVSTRTFLILGAAYVGSSYTPMVGYLAIGLSCIFAGVTVIRIRRRERSK